MYEDDQTDDDQLAQDLMEILLDVILHSWAQLPSTSAPMDAALLLANLPASKRDAIANSMAEALSRMVTLILQQMQDQWTQHALVSAAYQPGEGDEYNRGYADGLLFGYQHSHERGLALIRRMVHDWSDQEE